MHHIEVTNLTKKLKNNIILQNINLSLNGGKIYGFIGKNGSGKTMLFRILGGLVKPTSGDVFLNGNKHNVHNNINKIGLVIENASLYPTFTGLKNLMFLAKINNYINKEDVIDAITKVGLDPCDKRTISKYSLGMKQRIAIAQAIMEKPDFLFLDEPTNALDSQGICHIRNLIKDEARRGAVVLIASHNKDDIEQLCDKTFYITDGKITKEE
jgi:ABC-2 type transport system ATP-binding protein